MAFSANSMGVKFFVSNNTQEISIEKAYERLKRSPQTVLENGVASVLQHNGIEQGKFVNVLGAYQMATDKKITADNTEIFLTPPRQDFSSQYVFSIARQLSYRFRQESVAVFVPNKQSSVADIIVRFASAKPSIADIIKRIHQKIPAAATAFSLHLNTNHSVLRDVKVNEVEWLGTRLNFDEIKAAFPSAVINSYQGQAYLVYKNGQISSI